jgi:hypothetical protein
MEVSASEMGNQRPITSIHFEGAKKIKPFKGSLRRQVFSVISVALFEIMEHLAQSSDGVKRRPDMADRDEFRSHNIQRQFQSLLSLPMGNPTAAK